ncbi:MAG TPA: hypothetical protein DET40_05895 [Lentisphaeria bacterium]|nr:MAG: hypothetical protein A2X45_04400 [Lentisphaerae bacterium GWF2_50_93]HCE43060.1 hypothetical protein [Lentisphaeria bacterium]
MKKICSFALFLTTLCLALFLFTSNAFSQAKGPLIRDVSIDLDVANTPIWKVINVMEKGGISNRNWIQVEVNFTTAQSNNIGASLDDVSAEFEILLPTEDSRQPYVLVSGKVTYWAFAMDGGKHHLLAFIPPRIIEKWGLSSKKLSRNDVSKMDARVLFKYNDADIGLGFQVPKQGTAAAVAEKFAKAKLMPNLPREKNGILGQDKTPWAGLNYDYYEAVKVTESSK